MREKLQGYKMKGKINDIEFDYEWVTIKDNSGEDYRYKPENCKKIKTMLANDLNMSGVYKWEIINTDGLKIYFGETEDLKRRTHQYNNPGHSQTTNRLIKKTLENAKSNILKIIKINSIVNGNKIISKPLDNVFFRKMLENYFIFQSLNDKNYAILNKISRERRPKRIMKMKR